LANGGAFGNRPGDAAATKSLLTIPEQVPTRRAVFLSWESTFCSLSSKPDLVAFLQFYLESFPQMGRGDVSLFSEPSQLKPDAS